MKKLNITIITIVVFMAAGATFFWLHGNRKPIPVAQTISVTRGDLDIKVSTTGYVSPQNRVEVKPPLAGRVDTLLVKEGDYVQKGQIIAWISSTERAALLDSARINGQLGVKKWAEVYKPTPLVSPVSGTVIASDIEPGQSFTNADAVLVISDRLIIKAQVDETDIGKIKVGQNAEIAIDAYAKQPFQARVDHIAYEAHAVDNVTVYYVEVRPKQDVPFIRSGMSATVTFLVSQKRHVLLLPTAAIRNQADQSGVLKPGKKRPRFHPVETGATDGKQTEILSGLKEGDEIMMPSLELLTRETKQQGSPFMPARRNR